MPNITKTFKAFAKQAIAEVDFPKILSLGPDPENVRERMEASGGLRHTRARRHFENAQQVSETLGRT